MAKFFLSHSSEDAGLVGLFVNLLEDGIGISRSDIRCSSLPGYGLPLGSPFRDVIRDDIAASDTVIALVSQDFVESAYCMGEIGISWGLKKRIIPLLLPQTTISDIGGLLDGLNLANIADPGTLDSLWEDLAPAQLPERDFVRWQDRRTRFLSAVPAQRRFRDSWPIRGFWNSRAVDASLYVAPDIRVAALRGQVMNALEAGMAVPSHLFYITDQGSSRWLALAEDPLFAAYQDSMDLLFRRSDEMAREILRAAPFKDIDIISLGPGDGRKDALLLGSLLRLAPDRGDAFYYPFDISASMIARTLERIGRDATIRQRITQAKAIIADFNSLPVFKPIYQFREGPNLFLLLGNLLGNVSDDFGFLKRLNSRAMLPGDLLLLEVRLLPPVAETVGRDAGARGWLLKSKRFDFVPLELLGVPFKEDLLSYVFEADRGTIRGSQTIVAKYQEAVFGGKRFDDVELSYVHRYQEATLIAEIGRSGFNLIGKWISPKEQDAWLLLQRPN